MKPQQVVRRDVDTQESPVVTDRNGRDSMEDMLDSLTDEQERDRALWENVLTSTVPRMIEATSSDSLLFVGNEIETTEHPLVHNHPELAFVLEGTLHIETSTRKVPVATGSVIVVAPWMYHLPVPTANCTRILWIAFKQTHLGVWIIRRSTERPAVVIEEQGIDMISTSRGYESMHALIQELSDEAEDWLDIVKNDLSTLMIRIRRAIKEKERPASDRDRTSRTDTLVLAAQDYIERNYNRDTSISDVAHYVALSVNYFANLFKKRTGETIGEYITTVRIREAQRLLRQSDFMVSEIAYIVGYRSPYYFSRVFRKAVNQSPTEYRDSCGSATSVQGKTHRLGL